MRAKMNKPKVTPEEYRDFLKDVKLIGIYLKNVKANITREPILADNCLPVSVKDTASYAVNDEGFSVEHSFTLSSEKDRKKILKIECTFVLTFKAKKKINDDLFGVYENISLPLNTWPFVRELAFSISSRMNIPPLTLPLFKG
jgi:hypothetical protein